MRDYFIRRFLLIIPTLIGATLLVFALTRILPGGPIERALAEARMANPNSGGSRGSASESSALSDDQIQKLKEYYGFDKPWLQAYFIWLGRVCKGDLGESFKYNEPVWDIIKSRLPISTFYGVATAIITYFICLPLGVFKALRHRSFFDTASSVLVFFGYAIPGFALGLLLLVLLAYPPREWFPTGGFVSDNYEDLGFFARIGDVVSHSFLPLTCYVVGSFAMLTMLMKNNLMDNLAADYIRTAIAKGRSFRGAVWNHAIRNAFVPIATSLGGILSVFVTGSFLIEYIFDIDGIGMLGYKSLIDRDFPIVMGILLLSSFLMMAGNILSDVFVALVDPRVKFK
ncbi:MAG: ABC transporter permease subunit [Verrucomicrobiales bacterium]|nr:ABC transporter permease subunit [Verrucomicrobiales bacterium]